MVPHKRSMLSGSVDKLLYLVFEFQPANPCEE
jgi:hypothetical protein